VRKSQSAPAYPIQSVGHALALIDLFSERRRLTITEIARELEVAPSTASRLVAMLEHYGYAAHERDSKAYVVGTKIRDAGLTAIRELDIRPQTRPYLEAIAAETGETTQIGILQGQTVVFLDCVEGFHHLRVSSRVGTLLPAHSLSTGKALLAELSRDDLLALYPREALQRITPRTIANRTDLLRDLAAVKKRGYAIAVSESTIDIATVAVSIRDAAGRVRCAVSIAAPSSRVKAENVEKLVGTLRRSAKAIGATLF